MILKPAVRTAHNLIQQAVKAGDVVVDATAGNGKDTLFLATCVGDTGHVYAFDVQKEAVEKTTALLKSQSMTPRATVIHDSHDQLHRHIEESKPIQLGLFNLGYLPGGDKSIVTRASTTIAAAIALIERLASGGMIVLVIYPGHDEGQAESRELNEWAKNLDQSRFIVQKIEMINQINRPPYIIAIEKRD